LPFPATGLIGCGHPTFCLLEIAMALLSDLEQLQARHERGELSAEQLDASLTDLVVAPVPDGQTQLAAEVRRLKLEAALVSLDAEFEAIRQQCMVRRKRSISEPTEVGLVLTALVGGLFSLALGASTCSCWSKGDDFWKFNGALTLFLVVMTVASVIQHQRKLTRLTAARESWQRATKVIEAALAADRQDS
jgi:hypothetical protein